MLLSLCILIEILAALKKIPVFLVFLVIIFLSIPERNKQIDGYLLNQHRKGNGYTLRGGNSVKIDLVPSVKGSVLKGENLLPLGSKFSPFRVDKRGLMYRKANSKSQKLSPL